MIQSFSDKLTEGFFYTGRCKRSVKWQKVAKVAKRKLDMLNYASCLEDLRSPPANRLEVLKGNLKGYYSIRINDQWRVIFQWGVLGPEDVAIIDYHK